MSVSVGPPSPNIDSSGEQLSQASIDGHDGDNAPANDKECQEQMGLPANEEPAPVKFVEIPVGEEMAAPDRAEKDRGEIPPINERVAQNIAEEEYMPRYREAHEYKMFDWGKQLEPESQPRRRFKFQWPELLPGQFLFQNVTLQRMAVRYRNYQNEIVQFEGNLLGVTGVPQFPFSHIRELLPRRICVCMKLGEEFKHSRRWTMIQIDFGINVSLVSERMISQNLKRYPVTPRQIHVGFRGCTDVWVRETVTISLHGKHEEYFVVEVGVVTEFSNPTFDFNRIVIGEVAASRMLVGLDHAPENRPSADGAIVLADDGYPVRYFKTTFQQRRNAE